MEGEGREGGGRGEREGGGGGRREEERYGVGYEVTSYICTHILFDT